MAELFFSIHLSHAPDISVIIRARAGRMPISEFSCQELESETGKIVEKRLLAGSALTFFCVCETKPFLNQTRLYLTPRKAQSAAGKLD